MQRCYLEKQKSAFDLEPEILPFIGGKITLRDVFPDNLDVCLKKTSTVHLPQK